MSKTRKVSQKGSILVITTILISFLLVLLGGVSTALIISRNSNVTINKNELKKIESTKIAYSYYNRLIDNTYFENKELYANNIKEEVVDTKTFYTIEGIDTTNSYMTILFVGEAPTFEILRSNVKGVSKQW